MTIIRNLITLFLVLNVTNIVAKEKITYQSFDGITMFRLNEEGEKRIHSKLILPKISAIDYIFYATSSGDLTESTSINETNSSLSQNSNFSLGIGGGYSIQKNLQLSYSLYLSSINQLQSSLGVISFPIEYGGNIYLQKKISFLVPYAGIDYEKLSTLDYLNLSAETPSLEASTSSLIYLTLGTSKVFNIFNRHLLVKGSGSYLVSSSSDSGNSFTGYKFILFSNYSITKRIGLLAFFKYHSLHDQSNISIKRYGVGISYRFH